MSPQWIPQNIQKRLLLYILQQLSLFSAIDLPNLEEVSLNNIHLKDVLIDPEKVGKIPGFNLRSGKLRNIELTGGVSGVNFTVSGVELVIAPSVDNLDDDLKNMQMQLAQSTANLASTLMLEKDDEDTDSETDTETMGVPKSARSGSTSLSSSRRPSALGGMMTRAAEIALLRLAVNVTDIHIKFVLEPTDILIHIASLLFNANNGFRYVDVSGVKIATLKPHVSRGHCPEAQQPETPILSSNTSESEDDDGDVDESLMESVMFSPEEASSIYMSATSQSFNRDNVKMSEPKEAVMAFVDSVHLSFEGLSRITDLKIDVGTINVAAVPTFPTLSLVFNCILKMLKLKSHQLRKQKAASRRHSKTKFPEYDEADDLLDDDDFDPSLTSSTFTELHVAAIVVSLTSALTGTGTFASFENDLSIDLRNLSVKRKDDNLIYGNLETATSLRYVNGEELAVLKFDKQKSAPQEPLSAPGSPTPSIDDARPDLRFEIFRKADELPVSEITTLLPKLATLLLDCETLQYLTNFASALATVYENLNAMLGDLKVTRELNASLGQKTPTAGPDEESATQFFLLTSSFMVQVKLDDLIALKAHIYPISFNKEQDHMSLQKIKILSISGKTEEHILTIPNISMKTNLQEFKHITYRATSSAPRESITQCSNTILCGAIEGKIDFAALLRIKQALSNFLSGFLSYGEKVNALDTALQKVPEKEPSATIIGSYTSSIYSNQARFRRMNGAQGPSVTFGDTSTPSPASFRFAIKLIRIIVKNVSEHFGDMEFDIGHFEFSRHARNLHGFVSSISAKRMYKMEEVSEPVLREFNNGASNSPMVMFVVKSSDKGTFTDVVLRKFQVEYYAQWLELLKRDVTQGHNAEEIVHVTAPATASAPTRKSDIHFTLDDFVLGLSPFRLNSKLCLSVGKGSMDFTLGREQFYIKCSFRDLSLFLVDDFRILKTEAESNFSQLNPQTLLSSLGYVLIGRINSSHVGITVNTLVEEIKKRNERLGISGDLSLVDLKINSDDHSIELCADSAHTLGQTLNDLKPPTTFKNEDKFRMRVNDEFKHPQDILAQLEKLHNGQPVGNGFGNQSSKSKKRESKTENNELSDFCIVDEYYNEPNTLLPTVELGLSKLSLDLSSNSNIEASSLSVVDDHFSEKSKKLDIKIFPFSFNMNLSKTNIYLYDGYDWKQTRKSLRKAVKKLEAKAKEKNSKVEPEPTNLRADDGEGVDIDPSLGVEALSDHETAPAHEEEDPKGISDTLFQSIHLNFADGISPGEFVSNINAQVQNDPKSDPRNDLVNEKDSGIKANIEKHYKDLRLNRSVIHKVLASLKNIEINLTNFTSEDPRVDKISGTEPEKVNKLEVRLDAITVYDNVPTSTWNKILTYMNILGEREIGTSMLVFSLLNVRPDPKLAYTEAIMQVSLLPVRLYVDQDTLGFVTRFFEFRDTRFALPIDEIVYIQKLVVDPLKIKFDYKPKKVDYSGLRSGNNAEFVNFFILDGSDIFLRRAVVYGVAGLPKLGPALGKVYAPYIQKYQLAGLLSGLSPVRSIVNIGGGVKDLVAIPMKEYKKDGRLLRSLQKGTKSFAKTTTYELLKLGVKLALGTQVMLENLEEYFGGEGLTARRPRNTKHSQSSKTETRTKGQKKNGLLESSLLLKNSVQVDRDPYSSDKLYSATLDEVNEEDLELDELQPSILLFDQSSKSGTPEMSNLDSQILDNETEAELVEKMVSLYSNQPSNAKDGLKSAYKSLEKNMKTTKSKIIRLKNDLNGAENFQDSLVKIAKSSPVIVIRPMIGTTEAVMKTLMGISNGIDSRYIVESQDKYRSEMHQGEN